MSAPNRDDGSRLVRLIARLAARLYPPPFRRAYGDGFVTVADDRFRRELSARGRRISATVATLAWLAADTARALFSTIAFGSGIPLVQRGPSMFDRLSRHVRYAVRGLRHSPFVAIVAAISLAIGIGANVAVFTTANTLLFAKTQGIADLDRVVDIGRSTRGKGFDTMSYVTFSEIRDRHSGLSGAYAVRVEARAMSLGNIDGADRVYVQQASGGFFDVLGVQPVLGTTFHASDERLGVPLRRVVLSYGCWQSRFASDPHIVGREIVLNGDSYTITAVTPQGFQGTTIIAPDLWVPLTAYARGTPADSLLRSRDSSWVVMGARLKPGVTIARAQQEIDQIQGSLLASYPEVYEGLGLVVAPSSRVPGEFGTFAVPFVGILMGLTGLVLLVACANLAGLLIARAAGRSREIAVRLAIGASRGSLVAMTLVETLVLFLPGAAAALIVATGLTRVLASLTTNLPLPISANFTLDWRVLGFALVLTFVTALVTGLAPALQSTRSTIGPDLKNAASSPRRQRLRHIFVTGQMACCLLLLVVAGLLVRGLGVATRIDPGFVADGIDIANVDLTLGGYEDTQAVNVADNLRARMAVLPGVTQAAVAAVVPLGGDGLGLGSLRKQGDPDSERAINADWNTVSPEFLSVLGIALVKGRGFTRADRDGADRVAIVNERFARDVWPGQDPIGQHLETGNFKPGPKYYVHPITVVGVARNSSARWLGEGIRQFIYVPLAQNQVMNLYFFLRRSPDLAESVSFAAPVRQVLRDVNRNLPLIDMTTERHYADLGLLPQRIATSVAGSLGLVALVLSLVGLYGITAFTVAHRTREIGVRVALGADAGRVVGLVMRHSLRLVLIGGAIGLAGAMAIGRVLSDLLFGVSPIDPIALSVTTGTLIVTAMVAAFVPARRAARINPTEALRAN